jgi:HlyD family secretion protein
MGQFSFAGKEYKLKIKKIFTQVTNGKFQVDMDFDGEVPQGIRRGQTFQVRVSLSEEKQALLIPRGGYYQQTGGNWIFKVNERMPRPTKWISSWETESGLLWYFRPKAGDKVITSSIENTEIYRTVLKISKMRKYFYLIQLSNSQIINDDKDQRSGENLQNG